MRKVVQAALRTAYAGSEPADAIARRWKLSPRQVRRFWEAEKAAGRIPNRPRPHFARHVTPAVSLAIDPVDIEFVDPDDLAVFMPTAEHDPLLLALQREQGRDRLRGVNDEMPAQLLMIEAGDEYQRFTPSRSRVRDFQRGRDAYVAALMKDKPAPSNCIYARVGRAWWVMSAMTMLAGPFLAFEAAKDWGRVFGLVHQRKSP